ncbi:MAG: SDR family oxidoreductase [Trueperaceae bacterium]|nr:SDR family oxidoreductase [Trueperaceae bacterium]
MRVVILGGAGFLGQKLTKALLEKGDIKGQAISKLLVFDRFEANLEADERLEQITGDISQPTTLEKLILPDTDVIIHLAAIVSGEAEQNFDLGMQINLHATEALLEVCRKLNKPPQFLFASSIAVFGGDMPEIIEDNTAPTPQSSYGAQKAICELLINDYSRKGFIDGIILRFPTIVVRPGKPNAATSTFASSIIREPLQGQEAICPVTGDTKLWILSPRQAIRSAVKALDMDTDLLGSHRTLSLPGITVSVQDMVTSLEEISGKAVVDRIVWQHSHFIQQIVGSWPSRFTARRALELGFEPDASMTEIIQNFIEDDLVKT